MAGRLHSTNSADTVAQWLVGARSAFAGLGLLALAVATAIAVGLAAIVWVPFAFLVGCAMFTVWAARRHRQRLEGRDRLEVKDAPEATHPWPHEGIIDDRLPEP